MNRDYLHGIGMRKRASFILFSLNREPLPDGRGSATFAALLSRTVRERFRK